MKKMILGIVLTVVGCAFALPAFIRAAWTPYIYNGVDGLLGSFLGTNMLLPFVLSLVVICIGLCILVKEAYPAIFSKTKQ